MYLSPDKATVVVPGCFVVFIRAAIVGSNRVLRGGSWLNNAINCRSANRNNNGPGNRSYNYGLRLAFVP